jgi:hypothetical protein
MRRFLLLLVMLLLTTGCATKAIYQIDGMPIQDNIIRAKTFELDLTIKYSLTHIFDVKEDDETYETYEFLSLTNQKIHKLKNPKRLILNVNVFNPSKNSYKIVRYITEEGGGLEGEVVYEGNISRNTFIIELPLAQSKLVSFYYDACDKSDNLVFRSFKAQYVIEG